MDAVSIPLTITATPTDGWHWQQGSAGGAWVRCAHRTFANGDSIAFIVTDVNARLLLKRGCNVEMSPDMPREVAEAGPAWCDELSTALDNGNPSLDSYTRHLVVLSAAWLKARGLDTGCNCAKCRSLFN